MLFRTNCNQAADIELTLSLGDRKALNGTGMWPLTRRKIRWGNKDMFIVHIQVQVWFPTGWHPMEG